MLTDKDNIDKIDWHEISWYQVLSEEFIREFSNEVNWYGISWNQVLSKYYWEYKEGISRNIIINSIDKK